MWIFLFIRNKIMELINGIYRFGSYLFSYNNMLSLRYNTDWKGLLLFIVSVIGIYVFFTIVGAGVNYFDPSSIPPEDALRWYITFPALGLILSVITVTLLAAAGMCLFILIMFCVVLIGCIIQLSNFLKDNYHKAKKGEKVTAAWK